MSENWLRLLFAVAIIVVGSEASFSFAQDDAAPTQQAAPVVQGSVDGSQPLVVPAEPGQATPAEAAQATGAAVMPPGSASVVPAAAGEAPNAAGPAIVTRQTEPENRGDQAELAVRPQADGKVAFSFRNQPWPALIQWLSEISDQPLDWQELPGDYVNLASPREYSIGETRDLFNRHLLARGFTMLELDGGLTVVKIDKLNAAIVPRVSVAELGQLPPYSFIKTSLDCGWLLAPKLAEEFKSLVSPNGKIVALEQTNRLEIMDAAINLQQIASMLEDEQSMDARSELAREFELRHIPAEEAKRMLTLFLGIKEEKQPASVSPEMMQQMQMMQQQMMQQGGGGPPQAKGKSSDVSIVVNSRRNSLLVNAPPDRMAIAAQFVKQVDVPSDSMQSLADLETRVQVFRLTSLDPAKLAEIATDMNILEPATKMRVDEKNKALILSGSVADRYIIKTLIDRLDGSARKFEVLQLRRLDAQEVAESIMFLMGTEEKDDTNDSRRFMYSMWGGGGAEEKKDKDKFRVAANLRYRQVLLWANESEMAEVKNLLVKLGELPPEGGNASRVRRIEASANPDTYDYLERLRYQFEQLSPDNKIVLPPREDFIEQKEFDSSGPNMPEERLEEGPETSSTKRSKSEFEEVNELDAVSHQLVHLQVPASLGSMPGRNGSDENSDAENGRPDNRDFRAGDVGSGEDFERLFGTGQTGRAETNANAGAPIRIELDEEGNLLLISDDLKALDQLENLMLDVQPPKRPYAVFRVRHASASWIVLSLKEYFEDDDKSKDDEDDTFLRWIWDMPSKEEPGPAGLGGKRKLKFVSDNETGSVVVTGATTSQLKIIQELIDLWDVPESISPRQSRYTRLMPIRFSRAEEIAETIKDAYRDLLSSNDKAFAERTGQQGNGASGNSGNRNGPRGQDTKGSELIDSDGGRTSGSSDFSFRGKLSIGVDKIGNTLVVSAEGDELLKLVCEMIVKLDEAAVPQGGIEVREMSGAISIDSLETALRFMVPRPNSNGKPEATVVNPGKTN